MRELGLNLPAKFKSRRDCVNMVRPYLCLFGYSIKATTNQSISFIYI